MLKRLIREQIEPQRRSCGGSSSRRSCSAAASSSSNGSTTGGDFKHVPPCTSATQAGCVVAFSTWDKRRRANASLRARRQPRAAARPLRQPRGAAAAARPRGHAALPRRRRSTRWAASRRRSCSRSTPTGSRTRTSTGRAACGAAAWRGCRSSPSRASDKRPTCALLHGATWGLHTLDVEHRAVRARRRSSASQATAYTTSASRTAGCTCSGRGGRRLATADRARGDGARGLLGAARRAATPSISRSELEAERLVVSHDDDTVFVYAGVAGAARARAADDRRGDRASSASSRARSSPSTGSTTRTAGTASRPARPSRRRPPTTATRRGRCGSRASRTARRGTLADRLEQEG